MYFGNLVNPKWWSYIWLSEGFATHFANYIINIVFPEWRYDEAYTLEKVQSTAFVADVDKSIRPMTHYVESPLKILDLFDDIAYAKGNAKNLIE
jgi:aminopeptidase N